MTDIRCTQCGTTGLEAGFVLDAGEGSRGFARWVAGALEKGPLGGARRSGRAKRQIDAYRCPNCSHLELYATETA